MTRNLKYEFAGNSNSKGKVKMNFKYLIPSCFTFFSLIIGLFAIENVILGNFILASWLITLCMLMDLWDGKIARKLDASTPFGAELDSLVDIICFGLAPCILLYFFALQFLPVFGKIVIGIYMIASSYRLARFNSQLNSDTLEQKHNFVGLPITAAAGFLVSYVIFASKVEHKSVIVYSAFFVIFTSILMLSKVEFLVFNIHKNPKVKRYLIIVLTIASIKFSYLVYFGCMTIYLCFNITKGFVALAQAHHHKVDKLHHR